MKRTLTFDAAEPKRGARLYRLYEAVLFPVQGRTIEVIRREARLLDGLEAITEPDPDGKKIAGDNMEPRRLKPGTVVLEVEEADITDVFKKRLELPDTWLPKVSREIVDTITWLNQILAAPPAASAEVTT